MLRQQHEGAANTPQSRDRYIDFLRAFSILTVVAGHWFISLIYWRNGVIGTRSAIGVTPWMWLATWFLYVMPLFFFVGGFSNFLTLRSFQRRGLSVAAFLKTRASRLLKPSLVFAAAWTAIQLALHIFEIGRPTAGFLRGVRPPGATVPFGPLWFLAVYLGVILLSPVAIDLHRRFGVKVPVVLTLGIFAADAAGFVGGWHAARWANVAFAFLLPHQIGLFYADGRLPSLSRRRLATMASCALLALVLLTNPVFGEAGERWFPGIGHYPKSVMGTDVDPFSNPYPPTLVLAAMTFWTVGLAMLLRPRISGWLQRPGPWKAVILTNRVVMTLFLWHMTAFLIAILLLWPLGFGRDADTTARWWVERPLWLVVPGAMLTFLTAVFGRFEDRSVRGGAAAAS